MERLDTAPEEEFLKALVYGNPGTGKTSIGVTAPEPLILLGERQGMPHIRKAAKRLGIELPRVLLCTKAEDYRNALRALHALKPDATDLVITATETYYDESDKKREKPKTKTTVVERFEGWRPQTIVVDSTTEAMQLFADEIDRQSPPRLGKDGLPVRSDRYWGTLIDRCTKLVRGFRALPFNVLFLALMDDRIEGEGEDAYRTATPMVATRKLATTLASVVNVVGITYRKQTREKDEAGDVVYEYGVTTLGKPWQTTKPFRPLRDEETPDFGSWVARVNGDDDELPPAPSAPADEDYEGDAAPPAAAAAPPAAPTPEPEKKPTTRRRAAGKES